MKRRYGFTLVEILVIITVIGALLALLIPAVQAALPPYLEQQALFDAIDFNPSAQAALDPNNLPIASRHLSGHTYPSKVTAWEPVSAMLQTRGHERALGGCDYTGAKPALINEGVFAIPWSHASVGGISNDKDFLSNSSSPFHGIGLRLGLTSPSYLTDVTDLLSNTLHIGEHARKSNKLFWQGDRPHSSSGRVGKPLAGPCVGAVRYQLCRDGNPSTGDRVEYLEPGATTA